MDYDPDVYREQRATILSTLLCTLAGTGAVLLLFTLCGGLFLQVLAVLTGVAGVGLVHYLFWGRTLSQDVAGDREDEELRALAEADDGDGDDPYRHRW
jgi:hypothetical protein